MEKQIIKRVLLRWLCFVVAVATANGTFAQHVSRETARSVAETFFNHNVRSGQGQTVQFEDITAETPFQNFYIFSADSGFVLVAADERVTPILGYSKANRFVTEDMPENLRWWLEGYEEQVRIARINSSIPANEITLEWNNLKVGRSVYNNRNTVGPLLTTEWGQDSNYPYDIHTYNLFCPLIATPQGVKHCPTGCVATAMAQIMKKWNHPAQGELEHCYTPLTHPEFDTCVTFSNYCYDWDNMPNTVNALTSTEKKEAVARLMHHCGVASNMDYDADESNTGINPTLTAFKSFFGYSDMARGISMDWYSIEEWRAILMNELNNGRPVFYAGYYFTQSKMGAHAFVCDGYKDDGDIPRFHINWGWRGDNDGYYYIGSLEPGSGGTGSGEGIYNELNHIIIGLEPISSELSKPSINLVNVDDNNRTVTIIWGEVYGASYYRVYQDEEIVVESTVNNSFTINNALYGLHDYRVIAVDGNGHVSKASDVWTVNVDGPTPKPIDLNCSITNNNDVVLSWNMSLGNENYLGHHPQSVDPEAVQSVGTEEYEWIERFPYSEINDHYNKKIDKIGIYVQNSNVVHDIAVYSGAYSYPLNGYNMVFSDQFVPPTTGWYYYTLNNPISIPSNKDIWVKIGVENASHSACYIADWVGCTTSTSFVNRLFHYEQGTMPCLYRLSSPLHWLIDLHVTFGDELTYNVYRNDGHHLTCIARNLQETNFTDANVPVGVYIYYVTTNYYGGESEPSETVSVGYDNYTITLNASPSAGGSVSGGGTYQAGRTVTVSAMANAGYYFNGWMENGVVVNTQPNYTFTITSDRNLTAIFSTSGPQIFDGNVVTNPDGSKGVVFYTNPLGTGGTMVALEDASEGCPWGEADDIHAMRNHYYTQFIPDDRNGYANTLAILNQQGVGTGYAADVVDFAHGWYLPSANQLRKLYSALPFIEDAIEAEGGTTLATSNYWSSTEVSVTQAWDPSFAMSIVDKTSNLRVRAVRDFSYDGNFMVTLSEVDTGMVIGAGVYPSGMGVTVTAIPPSGYVFRCWTENGIEVSYDAEYTFNVYSHRNLEAHFSVENSIGSVITNADGSKGVLFWLSPNGDEGLMVALEDASEGCQWGETTYAFTLSNKPYNNVMALTDVSGNSNTRGIRKHQGIDNNYAASLVDFENGWYLPSVGELRKLYAALPMIETALVHAGGSTLTNDTYWSSTEYSRSAVATATFSMGNTGKTNTCRVRAIRHFATAGPNAITAKPNNSGFGTALGSGEYNYGQNVIVMARANPGYSFNAWKENGMVVSYDSIYQFPFTRSRSLVADFGKSGHVGSIVHNDDGSVGIVFYKYPIGEGGLMVALEDASEGCPWGLNEDVSILQNWSPDAVAELLKDMNGKNNTMRIRAWYDNNTDYAAGKVDYDNGWFLPSAGQLRKLYAALPMIESAIIQAGGSTLTEDTYWSSTEQSASNAWTPSFAMNSTNKTYNRRVRAIRSLPNTTYTIQVTANLQGGGTTSGSGVYDYGQLCTLKAVANPTYAFQCWKKDGVVVSTNMEYSFTVMGNQTYVACFLENSSNITTSADPSWMGTASGTGIYTIGSTCTLTAIPNQGYSFVNWTKGGSVVSTNPSYSFTVTESASYCAHFVITSYTINATANPTGCGTVTGTGSYNEGLTCTLTATANTGYTFLRWTENGQQVSTNPSYTFTVTRNRTLVAQFQPLSYTISASANPSSGGMVNGGGAYDYGTTCTVNATPASGYYFMNWTKDGEVVSINTSYSFTVTRDAVLVANFTNTRYTVTVTSIEPGQGTVSGGGAYVYGHTCTVTATPAEGYYFMNWTQNGEVVSTTETYTFIVEANTTLVAHFSAGSVIGDGGTAINQYLPSYSYYKYTLSQQIYTAEELGSAGFITSIAFYNGGATKTRTYDFYMKATSKSTFSSTTDWETVTFSDKVFSGSVTMAADGWTMISFDTPFVYDGSSNVVLVTSDVSGGYTDSPHMTCRVFTAGGNQSIYVYRDGSEAYNPSSPSSYSGTLVSVKNQLRFTKEAFGNCTPPTRLTATEVGVDFVELSWTELGTSEQWVVYYNGQWTTANTNENFRLEGLDSETEYTIKVRPVCDDDLWSNTITVTTLDACPTPRNVDVGNITPVAATVIWDGYSDNYNLQLGCANIVLHEEFSDGIPAEWNNSSDYPWTVVDGHIQSGNGGISSSTSSISVTVNFPDDGTISFDYWSRGEGSDSNDWDKSRFYIDDEKMFDYGKHTEWESYSTTVSAGTHTFRWEYKKDSSVNPDGDYFAVDNVEMKMGEIVWNAPVSVWDDVYSFTGLNPATTYCVRVQGVCGDIETDWSEEVFFTTFEGSTVYTFTKEINAYTADGGYYLIAVPLDEVNPEEVDYMLNNIYDLYKYDEAEELEWRNHKDNAFNLELGKGYLYANSEDVTLTFTGVPNSNNCTVTLKKTSDAETAGWNLVGNPFNQRAYLNRDFYVMNDDGSEIVAAERNYIMPMEGVFVVANYNGESLTFTQAKSANDDKRIVINLSQGLGTTIIDRAIVRFGEGSGLPKFQINESSTKLFIQQDGKDYAVGWADGVGELPICFKTEQDGTFTLDVSIENIGFGNLHLIDNLTGEDVDLLATPSYTFEAKTTDSASRFVLVIRTSM